MSDASSSFEHPFDTPLSSGLRFLVEIIAWIAGPWAAAAVSPWLIVPAAVTLIGLPAVFSTAGDKKQVIFPTPGPPRVALELALYGVAAVAPWLVWPVWAGLVADLVVVAALVTGVPRTKWLLSGAPTIGGLSEETEAG